MIHQLSSIHPEAKIGENVQIDAFVSIAKDVEIGDGTWIASNAVVMEGARIGKNCKIFPGAVVAGLAQDLKYRGEYTTVEIGDNTTIRECVTVNRATSAKEVTRVGSNCLLMAYSHIAHDCQIGNSVIIGNGTGLAGEVEVDDFAIVSAMTGVHQFVHIGAHSFVQAMSKVGKDVPPYVMAGREPLVFSGLNSVGLKRRQFSTEKIHEMQEIYRYIFQKGLNTSNAIEEVEKNVPESEERTLILDFIKNSPRGIIKGLVR